MLRVHTDVFMKVYGYSINLVTTIVITLGGLAVEKMLLAAAPVDMGAAPAVNSEGVGLRDSTTTHGLGPPAMERGSGEASPNV